MIRNIVFDMGNVLLRFDPELFVSRLDVSEEDRELLLKEVFGSPLWAQLDQGMAGEVQALLAMCRRLPPRLHACAAALLNWWQEILPIPGMEGLIRELKEQGYGLYVLSNAPVNLHLYFSNIPGAQYMDGLVVSADHKMVKPQRELYEVLLNRYRLTGGECFFIDDMAANVEGAKAAGLQGTVFTGDVQKLREDLKKVGISLP